MSSIYNNSSPMASILSVDVYPFKLDLNIIRKQGRRYRITYFALALGDTCIVSYLKGII